MLAYYSTRGWGPSRSLSALGPGRRKWGRQSCINSDTISTVTGIADIVARMRRQPAAVRFSELRRVCQTYFGSPRQVSTSHLVFKMPWEGDPRVNIQNDKGKAKDYQVRQVLQAIDKVEAGKR
jgi:hypothetical protein